MPKDAHSKAAEHHETAARVTGPRPTIMVKAIT